MARSTPALSALIIGLALAATETAVAFPGLGETGARWWALLFAYYAPFVLCLAFAASALRRVRLLTPADGGLLVLLGLTALRTSIDLSRDASIAALGSRTTAAIVLVTLGMAAVGCGIRLGRTKSWLGAPPAGRALALSLGTAGLVLGSFFVYSSAEHAVARGLGFLLLPPALVAAGLGMAVWLSSRAPSALLVGLSTAICLSGLRALAPSLAEPTQRSGTAPGEPTTASQHPSVVLIVLDTLRSRSLASYGYSRATTPNLDRFASEATLFRNHTTTSSWTLPAHASLFTGLLPSRHRIDGNRAPDSKLGSHESLRTLPVALRDAGYDTRAVVANFFYVGSSPFFQQGFEHFEAPALNPLWYRPLLLRVEAAFPDAPLWAPIERWFPTPYVRAAAVTDRALSIVNDGTRTRPLFLFLNYMDAHTPYTPEGAFEGAFRPPGVGRFPGFPKWEHLDLLHGRRRIRNDEADALRGLYDEAIASLDAELGRLLAGLRASPLWRDGWIVVTSDHGESLGEHDTLEHGVSLYDEILRVPLLVRASGAAGFAPGRVVDAPAQIVDVLPTLLRGVGLPAPEGIDGQQLLGDRDAMISEDFRLAPRVEAQRRATGPLRSIMVGRFKYIRSDSGGEELFDLQHDPLEQQNRAARERGRCADLRERLERVSRGGAPPRHDQRPSRTEELLRSLGYVR